MKAAGFKRGSLAVLFVAASAAWAGPVPQGTPFRVSSCPDCRQFVPAVAGHTTGAFLTVWEGSTAASTQGINGRFFTSTGAPQGDDFSFGQAVDPDKYDAAVTRDKKGNYILVWSSVTQDNSEIMAQKLQPSGVPLGPAFRVNVDDPLAPTVPLDYNPVVTPMIDGGFIVIWMSQLPSGVLPSGTNFPGTTPQVLARRFTATGVPAGAQVKVSTGLVNGDRPDACVDSSGRPVIVWTTVDAFRPFEPNVKGVSVRRLSAKGVPLNAAETVVAVPGADSLRPAVSCGNGSTFVVVWHSDDVPAVAQTDILGQRFSNQGRPAGAKFIVNSTTTGFQRTPAISHDPSGNFVVVWQSDQGSRVGIYGRRYTTKGVPTGPEFEVVSDVPNAVAPANPDVSHIGTKGNFVVVWQDGSIGGIYGLRFTP
ncbi:MAG TPA: hypothetical protein VF173_22625 [Thermoanaerobaculia bacterium]|nr:hypothetical protein [Thermoanaerobaculia bacterium]